MFQVKVLGTPKPSIQWYKDDTEIFACERIEMREEDEGGSVVLKEARLSDSGTIKCVASNILGRCTSTAVFSIEGNMTKYSNVITSIQIHTNGNMYMPQPHPKLTKINLRKYTYITMEITLEPR